MSGPERADGARRLLPADPGWPTQLDDLADPPTDLWWRGAADLRLLAATSVAIVGSRDATSYGLGVARDWAAELCAAGWCVVSGGAFGIDRAAHLGALAVGGPTIAVLAGGVDVPYPRSHAGLLAEIGLAGGLLAECAPGTTARKHLFLRRNRLIAALCRATVVVEAGLRSGALSTARHAAALCRPVLAVPGPVTSPSSAGTNRALQDRLAFPVTSAAEIIEMVTPVGAAVDQLSLPGVPARPAGADPLASAMARIRGAAAPDSPSA